MNKQRPKCKTYFLGVCPEGQPDGKCDGCDVLVDIDGGGERCAFCDDLTAEDYFTPAEKIAALLAALKELTGFRYIAVQGDPIYQPPKEAEHEEKN